MFANLEHFCVNAQSDQPRKACNSTKTPVLEILVSLVQYIPHVYIYICIYIHTYGHIQIYIYIYASRLGENRASVLSVFAKNVVSAIAKPLIIITKMRDFSRENQVVLTYFPVIHRVFCLENVREVVFLFQLAMRLSNMRPVFCKRFSLALSQRHCQILMLHISFGLTWPLTRVMAACDSLHIASTPPA